MFKDVSVEANQQRQLYAAAASVGIGDDLNAFIFNCSAFLFVLQISFVVLPFQTKAF